MINIDHLKNKSFQDNLKNADIVLFHTQLFCACFIVIFCLFALLFETGPQNLWILLLTTSVGYIMPSPGLKSVDKSIKGLSESTTSNYGTEDG